MLAFEGGDAMFFRRKYEISLMRVELTQHCMEEYAKCCMETVDECEREMEESLHRGATPSRSFVREKTMDMDREASVALRRLKKIADMEDSGIEIEYYETFGRLHPIKL